MIHFRETIFIDKRTTLLTIRDQRHNMDGLQYIHCFGLYSVELSSSRFASCICRKQDHFDISVSNLGHHICVCSGRLSYPVIFGWKPCDRSETVSRALRRTLIWESASVLPIFFVTLSSKTYDYLSACSTRLSRNRLCGLILTSLDRVPEAMINVAIIQLLPVRVTALNWKRWTVVRYPHEDFVICNAFLTRKCVLN